MARFLEIFKGLWQRSMMHRAMLVAPPVALILWAGYISVGQRSSAQYFTAKVDQGDISQVVQTTGTINPYNTVPVGSVVSGNIVAINVDFNSKVKKGDVLAKIDPTPFESDSGAGPGELPECHGERSQSGSADRDRPGQRGDNEGQHRQSACDNH